MHVTVPILTLGPYSVALVAGLLLYWNASLVLSRLLTAVIVSTIAMKLDLTFHLVFSGCHQVVALLCRFRSVWDPNDTLDVLQTQSQFYSIADMASLALLVGNAVQFWSAALVTRIALAALATRGELNMRWWEMQSTAEHALLVLGCVVCCVCSALQWAYYTLLPVPERVHGGTDSVLMWYTSIVYVVAVGLRSASTLVTAALRMWGYRALKSVVSHIGPAAVRALEDSGLNPFSEVHELYMQYLYAIACAATAWYYTESSVPAWMQCFMLMRLYLITHASGKLRHYRHVLDRFPTVAADPAKSCGICLDDFVSGETVKCLPCGHTFHGACVRSWLIRSSVCPACRHPVEPTPLQRQLHHQHQHQQAPVQQYPQQQQQQQGRFPRYPRPALDRGVPAAGGAFTGSLQPLAPRLPATAPPPRPSVRSTRPVAAGELRGSPLLQSLEVRELPYRAELELIDASWRTLTQHRRQQQQLLRLREGGLPAVLGARLSEAQQHQQPPAEDLLFTDTPLRHPELPAATARQRKRQRPPQQQQHDRDSGGDSDHARSSGDAEAPATHPRPRTE